MLNTETGTGFTAGWTSDLKSIPTPEFAESIRREYRRAGRPFREPPEWREPIAVFPDGRCTARAFDSAPPSKTRVRVFERPEYTLASQPALDAATAQQQHCESLNQQYASMHGKPLKSSSPPRPSGPTSLAAHLDQADQERRRRAFDSDEPPLTDHQALELQCLLTGPYYSPTRGRF